MSENVRELLSDLKTDVKVLIQSHEDFKSQTLCALGNMEKENEKRDERIDNLRSGALYLKGGLSALWAAFSVWAWKHWGGK